jgi:HK97 family phage major capsid protein
MHELEKKLTDLSVELKGLVDKAKEQEKSQGSMSAELKDAILTVTRRMDDLEVKLHAPGAGGQTRTLEQDLKENESLQRLMRDKKGTATLVFKGGLPELVRKSHAGMEQKTTVTSTAVGFRTSGVLQGERVPGIVPAARRRLFVQELLTTIPTSFAKIDYVKVASDVAKASPQTEGNAKGENAQTFTTAEASVRTIATWIPATRQILEDMPGLEGFLSQSLAYSVELAKEEQLLIGDNTGENLNGLATQASAFNTSLLINSDGWEKVDMVGRAIAQLQTGNESDPNFVAMNPRDWWDIRLSKDSHGNYIFGPPNMPGPIEIFGLNPIPTNSLGSGKFLVGDSSPVSAVIRSRMDLEIAISTEHDNFFTTNKVAIRAEERCALVVYRPAAYVYGTFTTSPA